MGSIKIGILGLSRVLFYFFLRLSNKRRKWKACAFVFVWPDGRWERRCRCVDKALLVLCCLTPLLFAEATLGFSGVLASAFEGAQPIPPPLPSSLFWGWRICSQPWVHISIRCLRCPCMERSCSVWCSYPPQSEIPKKRSCCFFL